MFILKMQSTNRTGKGEYWDNKERKTDRIIKMVYIRMN
jgi:hypothetical protein